MTFPALQELLMAAFNACISVGYVAGASMKGINLDKLEIRTSGTLDLRGFLGLSDQIAPGETGDPANDEPADPNALPDVVGLSVAQATRSLGTDAVTMRDATSHSASAFTAVSGHGWPSCSSPPYSKRCSSAA